MKINLRFGMHRDIPVIRKCTDLIDGLVIPAHILAYQHASTSAFVCSVPGIDYLIDPMTYILQSPRDLHLNDKRQLRRSVAKWCNAIDGDLAKILGAGGRTSADPTELPSIDKLCKGLLRFQTETIGAGHIDPRATKYLQRYGTTAATPPRCIVAPYFCAREFGDRWYSLSLRCASHMRKLAADHKVAAIVACTAEMASSADRVASDYEGFDRILIWIDRFRQASASANQIRDVRSLARRLASKGASIEFLYGGFMTMLMKYKDKVQAVSHGILFTQDKSFELVPGSGGVPERYYIPRFHDFRSLAQTNLILKEHPELVGGTPTSDSVMDGDPDKILHFVGQPDLLRRHFLEARKAECESLAELALAEQIAALKATHKRYHKSIEGLPNPDAVVTKGGMKGLDYLLAWAGGFGTDTVAS